MTLFSMKVYTPENGRVYKKMKMRVWQMTYENLDMQAMLCTMMAHGKLSAVLENDSVIG